MEDGIMPDAARQMQNAEDVGDVARIHRAIETIEAN